MFRSFVLPAVALLAFALPAHAELSSQSLDGTWTYYVDPLENGFNDYRGKEDPNGIFNDRDWTTTTDRVEYDFRRAATIKVPGDWNTQRPELDLYEGSFWYRRAFEAKPVQGRRYFLRFDAVSNQAIVYLNATKIGGHEGGTTPFELEVTQQIRAGENSLVVKVDNSRRPERIPSVQFGWWNYGGIIRSVHLLERPAAYVGDWQVSLDKTGKMQAWVQMVDAKGGEKVTLEIPELKAKAEAVVDRKGMAKFSVEATPERWSPESPKLYPVKLSAGEDRLEDSIGFRTLETRGPEILLNGKPVFLRGIAIHDEIIGPKGGRMTTVAQARQLLQLAKDLNCNFVRLAHYPHPEFMVREAERMGFMVWQEIPVYWALQFDNKHTLQTAHQQLEEMIRRDRNRASTIIWAVGNETPHDKPRDKFMASLAKKARQLDPTRLISAALEPTGWPDRFVGDPLGDHLDVIALNQYAGWYDGDLSVIPKASFKVKWDKPFVISEFGAEAPVGRRSKTMDRWSEDYMVEFYKRQLTMLSAHDNIRGLSPWILKDFRWTRSRLIGVQDFHNRKGLVSEFGQKKMAFELMRQEYVKYEQKWK